MSPRSHAERLGALSIMMLLVCAATVNAQSSAARPAAPADVTRAISAVGGTVLIARTLRDEIATRAPAAADSTRHAFERWLSRYELPADAESRLQEAFGASAWEQMQRTFDARLAPRVRRTVPLRVTGGTLRAILAQRDFDLAAKFGPELRMLREANVWAGSSSMASAAIDTARTPSDTAWTSSRSGSARPPRGERGRSRSSAVTTIAAPGRGVPDSMVAGLYWKDATRTMYGINGLEVYIGADLALLLTDGTAYRDPELAPAAIDLEQSRRTEVDRWGRWSRRGNDVIVRWTDGSGEVNAGAPMTSLSVRGPLDGAFSRTTGGGNTMVGGSVAGVRTRGIRFSRDGRFAGSVSSAMASGNAAGGAARRDTGTYTLTPFGVRLRYDDGREEFPIAYVYTADKATGRLTSIMLGAALLMAP
ncbi:MAG: hypothetical protein MUF00_05620 [Gemmatimonadaceae bacterium]|nr:hypothetical protein [Gemmatimonadaceae bacterium]